MDDRNMTVANRTGSYSVLTTSSLTGMTLGTQILLVNFVPTLGIKFSHNSNRQVDIKLVGCLSTEFGTPLPPIKYLSSRCIVT
jgi:hypothetical protein